MIVTLYREAGGFSFGDAGMVLDGPSRVAAVIDTGQDGALTEDGLILTGRGPRPLSPSSPGEALLAARAGYFGLRLVEEYPWDDIKPRGGRGARKGGSSGRSGSSSG